MRRSPSLPFAAVLAAALATAGCERTQPDAGPSGAAGAPAGATAPDAGGPAQGRIEADVRALADDAMEGREAGTPGYDRAAEYVAGRMRAIGLQPAGDAGSWFQQVPLLQAVREREGARLAVLRPGGRTVELRFQDQFLPWPSFDAPQAGVEAPAVFVGFGVHAPELDYDDFAGLDLKGKVAVLFNGAPSRFDHDQQAFYSASREKLRALAERGAVGAVFVNTAQEEARTPWARLAAGWQKPAMRLRGGDGGPLDTYPALRVVANVPATAADLLFDGSGRFAAQLFDDALQDRLEGFALPSRLSLAARTTLSQVQSRNVAGRIPGTDPALAAEHVAYTAHLDHVGVGVPVDGDKVYNGAIDNALGVAIMLEAARELAQAEPAPKRSLVFVAVTAEEKGLLGAQWFATHPSVDGPLVANINLDMPVLLAPSKDVVPIGVEHSTLKAVLDRAAKETGVDLSPDPFPEEVIFVRSDQFPFIREGIPAVYLIGGVVSADGKRQPKLAFTKFLRDHYHQPSDEADLPIVYGDAVRLAKLNARIGALVGDAAQRPAWNPGDFFGERFARGAAAAATPQDAAQRPREAR